MAKNLIELCVSVLWKVEIESNELDILAGKISKQCIENTAWVLLTACRKMQKEREIDEVIVKQNETELGRYRKFSAY